MRYVGKILTSVLVFAAASCSPNRAAYNFTGAGNDLYTSDLPRETKKLNRYLNELCVHAGTAVDAGERDACKRPLGSNDLKLLVLAGFNDIDRRCDSYLGWLDRKRIERLMYGRSSSALQGLFSGVAGTAGVGAAALVYVAEAFSFADSIYDTANLSPLMTLETSTVKTLVYQRQRALREAVQGQSFNSLPAAVFALRSYLTICTPQTILLDANEFSRGALTGNVPDLKADYVSELRSVGSLRGSSTPLARAPVSALPPPAPGAECRECAKLFDADLVGDPERFDDDKVNETWLKAAQIYLCTKGDGDVGPYTIAAVRIFEKSVRNAESNGKIDATELSELSGLGCQPGDVGVYLNAYEVSSYKPGQNNEGAATLPDLIDNINELLKLEGAERLDRTKIFPSRFRERVVQAKTELGLLNAELPDLNKQVDKTFVDQLTQELQRRASQ